MKNEQRRAPARAPGRSCTGARAVREGGSGRRDFRDAPQFLPGPAQRRRPGVDPGIPGPAGRAAPAPRLRRRRCVLLPEPRRAGEGREVLRQVRPRLCGLFPRHRDHRRPPGRADSRRMAAQGIRQVPQRGGEGEDHVAGRAGQADRGVQEAPRRAEGASRGRQQVDRHRRYLAVRRRRLQPRRYPRRSRGRPGARGQGLGEARIQEPRRLGRAGHAQHQARAKAAAQVRPQRGGRRTRHARHHPMYGEERGPAGSEAGARAAQHREGAAVLRHRRLDGSARAHLRAAVLGRARGVQAHGVLLFPQLHLRLRVAQQRAAPRRENPDHRHPSQVSARLQGDLRRRRLDVPLRDPATRWQRGVLQRGIRRAVDASRRADLCQADLAEPGSRGALGLHAIDRHHAAPGRGPHVPDDAEGHGRGDGLPEPLISGRGARETPPAPRSRRHSAIRRRWPSGCAGSRRPVRAPRRPPRWSRRRVRTPAPRRRGGRTGWRAQCPSRMLIFQPSRRNSASASGRLSQRSSGARNTVPALALITSGQISQPPRRGSTMPWQPPAAAERISMPRFCGLVTPSTASSAACAAGASGISSASWR